jgi:alkylation response protein AidB-like acyl-CoA dehydrogenase
VEKIKRDVRITRIYEGTSEIMEMTIARGRWQEHLKSAGDYYHARARELEALHAEQPEAGADGAALANHALAELLERCRVGRLTRHQHILLRLGALIAQAEGAAAFARRAARAAAKQLDPKAVKSLRPNALAAASRVYARSAALTIATEGIRLVAGADGGDFGDLEQRLGLAAIHRAQGGLLADMQTVADALNARKR